MYWTSPKGAFTALNPPLWLQHDLQIAERRTRLRHMKTLVLFADQMPHHQQANAYDMTEPIRRARTSALEAHVQAVFAMPLSKSGFAAGMAEHNSGIADTDNFFALPEWVHKPSGFKSYLRVSNARAARGLVILSASDHDPCRQLALDYQIDAGQIGEQLTAPALKRKELWHELGHIWRALCVRGAMSRRREERLCDVFSQRGCQLAGDPLAASLVVPLRALDALVSKVSAENSVYWNAVSMTCKNTNTEDEFGAQIDIKARALGAAGMMDASGPGLYAMASGEKGQTFRLAYSGGVKIESCLKTLAHLHRTTEYTSMHSRQLAGLTLRAGQRFFPELL